MESVVWSEDQPKQVCPGLFYAVTAQDGVLFRIRIPGGRLTGDQARVLAQFAEHLGQGMLQVTNRANVQIRTQQKEIPVDLLTALRQAGLAADPRVDHLRNLMCSPTAGIDPAAWLDVRPFIQAFDRHISTHPELAELPAKFSIGIDGGEVVSVRNRPNDIWLIAIQQPGSTDTNRSVGFQVLLNAGQQQEIDTGLWVEPANAVAVVIAVAEVYLQLAMVHCSTQGKKPRLRQILEQVGISEYLAQVKEKITSLGLPARIHSEWKIQPAVQSNADHHLGVHAQSRPGFSYIGLNLKLGALTATQLDQLADWVESKGATLQFTPWQTLLLADVADDQLVPTQQFLTQIGLSWQPEIWSALVACAGSPGCAAAATQTQLHAHELAAALAVTPFERPINIHFSGCPKSCAQHHYSDIALVGKTVERRGQSVEAYDLFVGQGESPFGQSVCSDIVATDISNVIQQLIHLYQQQPDQSFQDFVKEHSVDELQNLISQVAQS